MASNIWFEFIYRWMFARCLCYERSFDYLFSFLMFNSFNDARNCAVHTHIHYAHTWKNIWQLTIFENGWFQWIYLYKYGFVHWRQYDSYANTAWYDCIHISLAFSYHIKRNTRDSPTTAKREEKQKKYILLIYSLVIMARVSWWRR